MSNLSASSAPVDQKLSVLLEIQRGSLGQTLESGRYLLSLSLSMVKSAMPVVNGRLEGAYLTIAILKELLSSFQVVRHIHTYIHTHTKFIYIFTLYMQII